MKSYLDSSIIEHHEDGSRTETTVVTYQPVTKAQTALAVSGLVALCLAPLLPYAAMTLAEKWEDRRNRKAEANKLTSV